MHIRHLQHSSNSSTSNSGSYSGSNDHSSSSITLTYANIIKVIKCYYYIYDVWFKLKQTLY